MHASIAIVSGLLLLVALLGVRRIYRMHNRWKGFAWGLVGFALFFVLFANVVGSIDSLTSNQLLLGLVATANSLVSTLVVLTASLVPRPIA